ncbi:MAG: hypothetical protein K2W95_05060 [Candidatus Obscuribacterales bacterium]|nr:hypothetical protein [Candidatus Obscuribacterales bacterium]
MASQDKIELWCCRSKIVPIIGRQLPATAKSQDKVVAVIDGLLAATALHHNLVIATRNANDFAATPVFVHNPWMARSESSFVILAQPKLP